MTDVRALGGARPLARSLTDPTPPPRQGQLGRLSLGSSMPAIGKPEARAAGGLDRQPSLGQLNLKAADKPVFRLAVSAQAREALAKPGPTVGDDRTRMIDSRKLRDQLGHEPKRNAKLFGVVGPRVWSRSGTYKGVLRSLDTYTDALKRPLSRDSATRGREVEALTRQLDKVDRTLNRRLDKKPEQATRDLHAMVRHERKLLATLADGGQLPASTAAMDYDRALEMRHKGLPPRAQDDLATYNREAVKDPPGRVVLGSGAVNTVSKVQYDVGGGMTETKVYKQTISVDRNLMDPAAAIGIDEDDPHYAARNVATSVLNDALGLDVIPKTSFASHDGELGTVMDWVDGGLCGGRDSVEPLDAKKHAILTGIENRLGGAEAGNKAGAEREFMITTKGHGFKPSELGDWEYKPRNYMNMDVKNPILLNKLNDLEWLDNISGQSDRHMENFIIQKDTNGNISGVKGIDNDFSFGPGDRDPVGSNMGKVKLPKLIDSQTAQSIKLMSTNWDQPGGMKAQLSGLLTREEVTATRQRLDAVVTHIGDLERSGSVVPHGHWDTWRRGPDDQPAYDILSSAGKGGSFVANIEAEVVREKKLFA